MSRIDYITIVIVGICVVVLIYVLVQMAHLNDPVDRKTTSINPPLDSLKPSVQIKDTLSQLPDKVLKVDTPSNNQINNTPVVESPTTKTKFSDPPEYMVIAASFNYTEIANREKNKLIGMGYENAALGYFNKGKIVAVIAGRFTDQSAAQAMARKLRQEYRKDAYVQRKIVAVED